MRTVRGLTLVALTTVLALALVGILGTRTPARGGDHTSLADDRQLPAVDERASGVVCTEHLAERSDLRGRR